MVKSWGGHREGLGLGPSETKNEKQKVLPIKKKRRVSKKGFYIHILGGIERDQFGVPMGTKNERKKKFTY